MNALANVALRFDTIYLIPFYFMSCAAIACDMRLVKRKGAGHELLFTVNEKVNF